MDAAEEELRRRGAKTVVLATTNDNVRALNFYMRRGYRLVRLHLDAMDGVRARKPGVPSTVCRCKTCRSWKKSCNGSLAGLM
jgi:hypothetical protein